MSQRASSSDEQAAARPRSIEELIALFEAHVDGVYTVAHRIVWNTADADDIAQTTFLRAFLHLDDLREADKARAWLYRIAYREAIAVLRRRRDIPVDPFDLPETVDLVTPESTTMAAELAETLVAAIGRLPASLRAAFVLRDVEGLSMIEVASTLDVGHSAAKMRVHRARALLRIDLEEMLDVLH